MAIQHAAAEALRHPELADAVRGSTAAD